MINAVAKAIFGSSAGHVEYKATPTRSGPRDRPRARVDRLPHDADANHLLAPGLLSGHLPPALDPDAGRAGPRAEPPDAEQPGRLCSEKVVRPWSSDSLYDDPPSPRALPRRCGRLERSAWCCCSRPTWPLTSTDDSNLDGLAGQDLWTKLVGPRPTDEPDGLAISKQHPASVRFVHAVLQEPRTDGQRRASYAHWIGAPAPAPSSAQYGG